MKTGLHSFSKATLASVAASAVDFGTLTFWVEILKGFYPIGVALGAGLGAITNFSINRYWSFEGADKSPLGMQAVRYALVSVGSLLLNTGGVWLVTEKLNLFYMFSKIAVGLSVGVLFNYPLHRYFVYPEEKKVPLTLE